MEIIKKISKKRAWIQVGDNEAMLVTFSKDKTDAEMKAFGDAMKEKKDRLKYIQAEIKRLQK